MKFLSGPRLFPVAWVCLFLTAAAFSQTMGQTPALSEAHQAFYSAPNTQSIDSFRHLAAQNPNSYPAQLFLARSLLQHVFTSGFVEAQREIGQALAKALKLHPGSNEVYRDMAYFYLLVWDSANSQRLFRRLVDHEPQNLLNIIGGIRANTQLQNATEAQRLYSIFQTRNAEQLRELFRRVEE